MPSSLSPLLLPLRADLYICGSHIKEYVTLTNTIESVGESMTRTMNIRNMNSVTLVHTAQSEDEHKLRKKKGIRAGELEQALQLQAVAEMGPVRVVLCIWRGV